MEVVTLVVALVGGVVVFLLAPVYGLVVYLAAMTWYPSYLTLSLGTVDFNVGRIVMAALLASLYLQTDLPGKFRITFLDKAVLAYFGATVVAGAFTAPELTGFLVNRAGALFDEVLPYFAVRLIVRDRQQYLTVLKAILIVTGPLALLGLYQTVTGHNPAGFFLRYHAWRGTSQGYVPENRLGFFRANLTFDVSIMFGLLFATFGPACAGLLRNVGGSARAWWVALLLMGVGVFSSMSSGPLLTLMMAIAFMAFYRYRIYRWTVIGLITLMCLAMEVASNRHFYNVIDRFTFNAGTAWYRSRLVEVAIFENGMAGHWLTGFGFADPGWNRYIDMAETTDMVNHYLLVLCRFGLVGLIPFLVLIVATWRNLFKRFWMFKRDGDRWLVWCLAASLFGLLVAFFTVSLFGPPTTFFFMLIGFCGVADTVVEKKAGQALVVARGTAARTAAR